MLSDSWSSQLYLIHSAKSTNHRIITITIATNTDPKKIWEILKWRFFCYFRNCLYRRYLTQMYSMFSEIVMVRINWQQNFLSSNSVCNHTRDWQIRLPLGGRPILLITRMITDRIGFYSVQLPSFIAWVGKRVLPQYLDIEARKLYFVWITFSSLSSCNFDI